MASNLRLNAPESCSITAVVGQLLRQESEQVHVHVCVHLACSYGFMEVVYIFRYNNLKVLGVGAKLFRTELHFLVLYLFEYYDTLCHIQ